MELWSQEKEKKLVELEETVGQLKLGKKKDESALEELNKSLLRDLATVTKKELVELIKTQVYSCWGRLTRVEATDAIVQHFIRVVRESQDSLYKSIQDLKREATFKDKQIKQLREAQAEAERESEDSIGELSKLQEKNSQSTKQLQEAKCLVIEKESRIQQLSSENNVLQVSIKNRDYTLKEQDKVILKLEKLIEKRDQENKYLTDLLREKEVEGTIPNPQRPLNEQQELETMPFEKISKIVCRLVPNFSGERNADITNKVYEFLNGCTLAKQCVGAGEEATLVTVISTKLSGEAFQLFRAFTSNNGEIKTIVELEKLIKTTYLTARTLDNVMAEIKQAKQDPFESIRAFSVRLSKLNHLASEIILSKYDAANTEALKDEIKKSINTAFKIGLANPSIRQYMLTCSETDVSKSVEQALNVEMLINQGDILSQSNSSVLPSFPSASCTYPQQYFNSNHQGLQQYAHGSNFLSMQPNYSNANFSHPQHAFSSSQQGLQQYPRGTNVQTQQKPSLVTQVNPSGILNGNVTLECGFCGEFDHTYKQCQVRLNTPYCPSCKVYGHNGRTCPKARIAYIPGQDQRTLGNKKAKKKCLWCARFGHEEKECLIKKNYLEKTNAGNE